MKVTDRLNQIVKESLVARDPNWGEYCTLIDHQQMGGFAKQFRLQRRVRAVDVGKLMRISKARIHFLENGRTMWSLKTLTKYMACVVRLAEQGRKNEKARQ